MTHLAKKPENVRQILAHIDPEQLKADLWALKDRAAASGAQDCAVIPRGSILFCDRLLAQVAADNRYPSVHWPLEYPRDDLREAIDAYAWAVFFRLAAPEMPDYGGGPVTDEEHRGLYRKAYEIVTIIESAAFYMGYHLSLGLATGNCRGVFCVEEKRCWAGVKGRPCVRPNMGRPSMEAAGIDAAAMAGKLKWTDIDDPCCRVIGGLVLIT